MRLAIGQINSRLGDFIGNKDKILEWTQRAAESGCDLVVFPEASLFGYHPVDLLERPSLVKQQTAVLKKLHAELPQKVGVLIGAIVENTGAGKAFWNAAVFLERGSKPKIFAKQLLPTYDVFDESRHIQPGDVTRNILKFKGQNILITICEDIWAWPLKTGPRFSRYKENPIKKIKPSAVDLVLNLSASPFTLSKLRNRQHVVRETARHLRAPLVYVNMVGAQDELIFDGGSFAVDAKGKRLVQCERFQEDFSSFEIPGAKGPIASIETNDVTCIRQALVLGIRDYVAKTGFQKIHLGLSGGLDSAVVACLAVEAIGPSHVTTFALPGPFSSPDSARWAARLAKNLKVSHFELPIKSSYDFALKEFETVVGHAAFGVTNENLQARLRGVYLMSYSNRAGSLLLGTSNKSEMAVGYGTLYGDLCAGLQPIGDLLKTEVYSLAHEYNKETEVIPKEIVDRAPSAELRAHQKDQDSLPPYETLDPIVKKLVEGFHKPRTDLERKILSMMMKSEFKRWQSAPILKVSDHAFGRGRRFPVAHSAQE